MAVNSFVNKPELVFPVFHQPLRRVAAPLHITRRNGPPAQHVVAVDLLHDVLRHLAASVVRWRLPLQGALLGVYCRHLEVLRRVRDVDDVH